MTSKPNDNLGNAIWPIFIPSKGRPTTELPKLLGQTCAPVLVVEPQEFEEYALVHGERNLLVLPDNNQGIAYVRNFILAHCREHQVEWYWMFDDDITGFFRTEGRKLVRTRPDDVLLEAQALIARAANVGQAALEYGQFAWSADKAAKFSGYCDVAVAINTNRTRLCRYRAEMNLKEDRDFTLQVMKFGARTMRCAKLSFRAPKNGSNEGGLKPLYDLKTREREAVDRMVKYWGREICTAQTKPDGRYDLKINWKYFDILSAAPVEQRKSRAK